LWIALAAVLGVALTIGLELSSGAYEERRLYLGSYLLLVFGLGWLLAQFNGRGNRKLLGAARVMAGVYAALAIAVTINCHVFGGTKPYGMAIAGNPDTTYLTGVVRAVDDRVEDGAVVIPLGVSGYIDKDYARLQARLDNSRQTWIVDNYLVDARDVDAAFRCLAIYQRREYVVADMDTEPNPPSHKVYHALIRRIVDAYRQAVARAPGGPHVPMGAGRREVSGKTFFVADRQYLLTTAQEAVELARTPTTTR
jgi:hypothetical protein